MKRGFKKTVKITIISFLILLLIPLLVVSVVLLKPQVIINSSSLKTALKMLEGTGFKNHYDKAELKVSSDNLLRKKIFLGFNNVCIDSSFLTGCFSEIAVNFKFQIQKPFLKIVEIGPVILLSQKLHVDVKDSAPKPEGKPSHFFKDILPEDLSQLRVYPVKIKIQEADVQIPGSHFLGNLDITDNNTFSSQGPWQGLIHIDGSEEVDGFSTAADFIVSSPQQILTGPLEIKGKLRGSTPLTQPFNLKLQGSLFGTHGAFNLVVSSHNACFEAKEIPIHGCLNDLDVGASGEFINGDINLRTLNPVKVVSDKISIVSQSQPAQHRGSIHKESGDSLGFLKNLLTLQFKNVDVQLPEIQMISAGVPIKASLSLVSKSGPAVLQLKLNIDQPSSKLSGHAQFTAIQTLNSFLISGPVGFKSQDLVIDTSMNVELTPKSMGFSLDALLDEKPWGAHIFIKGDFDGQNIKGGVSKLAAHSDSLIFQGPEKAPCLFDIDLNKKSQFECNISLSFTSPQVNSLVGKRSLDLKMDVSTKFPPSDDTPWNGYVSVKIPGLKNEVISANGEVKAVFENTKFDKDILKNINIQNDLNLEISDFAQWVNKTYSTSFAIPAPLNALKGRINVTSHGMTKGLYSKIPLHLAADLHGDNQTFVIDGDATLEVVAQKDSYVPQLDGQIVLKDVQLMLPRLNLAAPPALIPDSRITTMKAVHTAEKANVNIEPGFLYNINLKTPQGQPVRLISNLAQGPIPIVLDLTIKTVDGLRGKIGIEKFPVELFNHKAQIIRLNLNLVSMRLEENIVDGEASIAVNDYTIFIDLSGNPKAPVVRFHSEPPLPQNQIVPVVLFGKTPESLDADQKSSSNNFQSALQDQALPLASFFFLASTPIESVGYDTQAKIFTAKLRIRQGLSLDVGSNGSQVNQVGLNKRLGKSWSIRTYVKNPTDQTQTQSVTAFLEKLFQY